MTDNATDEARAALAAEPLAPPLRLSDFETLQGIALDMVESLRPIVIPEILGVLRKAIKQPPASTPPADGEAEKLAALLEREADCAAKHSMTNIYSHADLRRAAALLRQLPPVGLSAEEYFHTDSGARIVHEPCDWEPGMCWVVYNCRHISPFTEFPTLAAVWETLQQSRRQEVGK